MFINNKYISVTAQTFIVDLMLALCVDMYTKLCVSICTQSFVCRYVHKALCVDMYTLVQLIELAVK